MRMMIDGWASWTTNLPLLFHCHQDPRSRLTKMFEQEDHFLLKTKQPVVMFDNQL